MDIINGINELKPRLSENQLKLLEAVLQLSNVDQSRSDIYENDGFIILKVMNESNDACPFSIGFGINENRNLTQFYLKESAAIIEDQLDEENVQAFVNSVIETLCFEIVEKLSFVKGEIVKARYDYQYKEGGELKWTHHVTYNKPFWFLGKKTVKEKRYVPWE